MNKKDHKVLTKDPPWHKRRRQGSRDGIKIRGFFRLHIEGPDGTIVGDSGWVENLVTNLGFKQYLADNIGKAAGSKQIAFAALGTGGAPIAADTTLAGEIMTSTSKTALTYLNLGSKSAQFTATFASVNSFFTGAIASNISNIGLFDTSTAAATLFSGNTYASSSLASNNNVNVTYTIGFQ